MNKAMIILAGFLFIAAGIATGVYQTVINTEQTKQESIVQKIREGEEFLQHNDSKSVEKAIYIFTELSSRISARDANNFRVNYNLAVALEKNGERTVALEKYRKLNQLTGLGKEESQKLNFSLGKILLNLNQDEEGKSHLEEVLRSSTDRPLRSRALSAIADYHYKKKNYANAGKNYVLAIQEDAGNVEARIGWGKSLRAQGKNWAAYEVYDEYLAHDAYLNPEKEKQVSSEYRNSVFEKGLDLFRKKRYQEATDFLVKSADMNPGTKIEDKSFYYIAECYDAQGDPHKALQYINKTLNNSDYSMDDQALYKKGTIYFRQKNFARASAVFEEVIEKYPDSITGRKAVSWKKESLDQLKENTEMTDKYDEKASGEAVDDTVY